MSLASPLNGIRVLDFTRILAGPYCTMLLGDIGATVLKVERPGIGDDTRNWQPPSVGNMSCYFACVNRNKMSVAIDLKKESGKKLIKALIPKCDVVVENFLPSAMEKLGLGYDSMKTLNKGLIYCSITGYGTAGPYVKRGGYDVIAAAIGGLVHITGHEDGEPSKVGVAMTDITTGLYAKGAILAALLQRGQTGLGQRIDCNLLSTQVYCVLSLGCVYLMYEMFKLSTLVNIGSNYLNTGMEAKRWGTSHASIVPYQAFKTSDGYFVIGAGNEPQFVELCKRLDLEHLTVDPRFQSNADRVKNRGELIVILSNVFVSKSNKNWLSIFQESSLPYGPVNDMQNCFSDPQVLHNNQVKSVQTSNGDIFKVVGPAVNYSDSLNEVRTAPPLLGEHTAEVLSQLAGIANVEIDQLCAQNVIQCN